MVSMGSTMKDVQKDRLPLQVHLVPSTNVQDSCLRALRAIQALSQARDRADASNSCEVTIRMPPTPSLKEASLLAEALRATPLGQVVDLGVLTRLAPHAELKYIAGGTTVELCGETDALYIVLTGAAEILAGPSQKARALRVTVEAAQGLQGDSEIDRLDPYVQVKLGNNKQYKSEVLTDAGSDPRWNWTFNIPYNNEPEIEFTVLEYDLYSRHDNLGMASVSHIDFSSAHGFTEWLMLSPAAPGLQSQNNPAEIINCGKLHVSINMITVEAEQSASLSRTSDMRGNPLEGTSRDSPGPKTKARGTSQVLDTMLGPGQYFGREDGGGTVRTLEDCQMMVVTRLHVSEAFRNHGAECRNERDSILRKHLPGAGSLDNRSFSTFAGYWQSTTVPRGRTLCAAGPLSGDSEARKVYVITQGTCRMKTPAAPREEGTGPPRASFLEPLRCPVTPSPVGLLGPGAVLGYASALFDVPEPYTVVAEEHVSVLWLSTEQRPLSAWPREVVTRLHEMLKAKTEWHSSRTKNIQASIVACNGLKESGADRLPGAWSAAESPKLRHKDIGLWREETLRDMFDAEGWDGGQPAAVMRKSPKNQTTGGCANTAKPCSGSSRSFRPSGPLVVASASPVTPGGAMTPIMMSSSVTPKQHASAAQELSPTSSPDRRAVQDKKKEEGCGPKGAPSARGIYAVNTGLGRCKTPWGAWEPSGMLPSSQKQGGSRLLAARNNRKKIVMSLKDTSGARSSDEGAHYHHGELRKVDLKCPSDWQQLSGMASSSSLSKMFKQRQRRNTIEGSFASGDGSSRMSQSYSEGALRSY